MDTGSIVSLQMISVRTNIGAKEVEVISATDQNYISHENLYQGLVPKPSSLLVSEKYPPHLSKVAESSAHQE